MGAEPLSVFLDQGLVSSQTQYYIVTVQRMILGITLSLGHQKAPTFIILSSIKWDEGDTYC